VTSCWSLGSRGVEDKSSLDVIWGKHAPTSGHPMAFEKGQNGRPVNRVFAGELDNGRSGEVTGDELLDLLGRKPALDLFRTPGSNTTGAMAGPDSWGRTEDAVIELPDDNSKPGIDQSCPWDTVPVSLSPGEGV
jgi:hypothetical protein